jgi:predicted transcriptional regulator
MAERRHGRRSKLDIVGDVLRAIREGAERPTNIMFRANLTWPLTVTYLELLLRSRMVRTEPDGDKLVYRIEPKGAALLNSFLELEERAAELGLDRLDHELVSKVMSEHRQMKAQVPDVTSMVRRSMERKGFTSMPSAFRGLSGVEHRFDLLLENKEGLRFGYIVVNELNVADVMKAFIIQTDCELKVGLVCGSEPGKETKELAATYGVKVVTKDGLS